MADLGLTPLDAGYRKPKADPHVTVDFLRGLAPGLTSRLEKAEQSTGYGGLTEGMLRSFTPETPAEIPLMALGAGKAAVKPALAAAGALASIGDAEAATPLQKMFYNLLRETGGDVNRAKKALESMRPAMGRGQQGPITQLLKGDVPDALVRRELMTDAYQPNVYDIMENRRQQRLLTPEQAFKIGDVIVPVSGDTSLAGVNVKRAGIDLKSPVELQGGHEYGLASEGGAPWASEWGAANTKQKGFERAAKGAKGDVKGVHVAMAPEGSHFAKHVPALWREMLRSGPDIPPEHMLAFNTDVIRELQSKRFKKGKEVPGVVRGIRDWQGVTHNDVGGVLDANPEVRKALMATAGKPGFQSLGFPDMDRLYGAALDPGLRTGDVGGAVMRAAPGQPLRPGRHATYSHDFPGELEGRLEIPIPAAEMFPEAAAAKGGSLLGSLRTAYWAKPVTQQSLDRMMRYTEAQKRMLREGSY